jgi:hypothetical protein
MDGQVTEYINGWREGLGDAQEHAFCFMKNGMYAYWNGRDG